jgi:hypothetical protein
LKVSTLRLHTPGFTSNIIQALDAIIAYAEQHQDRRTHTMEFSEFCTIAGYPLTATREEVVKFVSRTSKATASIRVAEVLRSKKRELLAGTWPVFNYILINETQISFEVCAYMWDELPTHG